MLKGTEWPGVICAIMAGALWGSIFVVPEMLPGFTAAEVALGRYLVYGMASVLVLACRSEVLRWLHWRDYLTVFLLGLSGNVVFYLLVVTGVELAGAELAALFSGVVPVTLTVAGNRRDRCLIWRQLVLPLGLILAGLGMMHGCKMQHVLHCESEQILWGMLVLVLGVACWTWYALKNAEFILSRPELRTSHLVALTGLGTLAGVLVTAPILYFTGHGPWALLATEHTSSEWMLFAAAMLFLGLLATWIPMALWNRAGRLLPVTLMGQLVVMESIFGLLYALLLQGRWPDLNELLAVSLLAAGVVLCVRRYQQARLMASCDNRATA
ncbi:DMT family transporter [Spongorhabdus nitratireducens]